VRERLVSQRTGIINQIRAFLLERGVAVRQGLRFLRAELPRILATPCDALSRRMVRVIEDLAADWRRSMSGSKVYQARSRFLHARMSAITLDERAGDWADHLQRDGGRNRQRRCVCERPRPCRLAGPSPQADLDRRPHGVMTAIWGRGPKILWDLGRPQRFLRTSGFLQSDISDGEVCWGDGRSHRACSA